MYLAVWPFRKWSYVTKRKDRDGSICEPKKHTDDNVEAKFFSVVKGLIPHAFKSNG